MDKDIGKGKKERVMGLFTRASKKKVIVVSTKEELKKAIENKEKEITVVGDLAKKINWMAKLSPAKIAALISFFAVAAFPNPLSGASALAATGLVGTDVALIIFTCGVSISVILAVLRGYDVTIEGKSVKLNKK